MPLRFNIARKSTALVESPVDPMESVFMASGDAIFEWAQELIRNYSEANALPWEDTTAAVGKALLFNGVSAMAVSVCKMTVQEMAELCDDVTAIVAGRLEEQVSGSAA